MWLRPQRWWTHASNRDGSRPFHDNCARAVDLALEHRARFETRTSSGPGRTRSLRGWPRDDALFTFVTEGVARAVELASEVAGDGLVGVAAADVVQQCINLGLLDEITVTPPSVLLGSGVRLFDHLSNVPVPLDDPVVIEGTGVTHLRYRVQRT
jgi:hypothetical protein